VGGKKTFTKGKRGFKSLLRRIAVSGNQSYKKKYNYQAQALKMRNYTIIIRGNILLPFVDICMVAICFKDKAGIYNFLLANFILSL